MFRLFERPGKKSVGERGEDLAARHLRRRGCRVLKRNYASPLGEMDIIARDGEVLVVVEVKTRASDDFGGPLAAVDVRKQRKLAQVAQCYLKQHRLGEVPCRFDVVGVTLVEGKEPVIEHIRDAFTL